MTGREKMIGGSEAGRIRTEGSEKARKRGLEGVHAERKGRMWGGPAAGRKGMKSQARKREAWGMVMQGGAEEWRVDRQREREMCVGAGQARRVRINSSQAEKSKN